MGRIRVSNAEADAFAAITQRLRRYRSMVANYQACKELYDQLFPSGTHQLTDMPRAQNDVYEPERWAQKRWSMRDRMETSLAEMQTAYQDLEKLVNSVTGDYNTVLVRRYLLNESWEVIAEKMHYCSASVRNKHNRAIDLIIKSSNF